MSKLTHLPDSGCVTTAMGHHNLVVDQDLQIREGGAVIQTLIEILILITFSLANVWISLGGNNIDLDHYWHLKG